ncbi:MAG: DUF378 domain-containing protein [Desulfovibrionales bacterium]
MKTIDVIAFVLVVIGAINWGLVGLFGFNLVAAIFGEMSVLTRIIYVLVGIAGIYEAVAVKAMISHWAPATSRHT